MSYVPTKGYRDYRAREERRLAKPQSLGPCGARADGDLAGLTMVDWATGARVPYDPSRAAEAEAECAARLAARSAALGRDLLAEQAAAFARTMAQYNASHPPKRRRKANAPTVAAQIKPAGRATRSRPAELPAAPPPVPEPAAIVPPAINDDAEPLAVSIVDKRIWFLSARSGRIERLT